MSSRYLGRATRELEELTSRTRKGWKRQLLELVQRELAQAIEKARLRDEDGSHRLFVDAEIHFRQSNSRRATASR